MYEWNFEPGLMVNLALIAAGYALCVTGPLRRFFPGNEPPTPVQVRLFFVGWVVLFIALASPIDSLASYLLTMHMLQHLLLAMVAPPFLLLGLPRWVLRPLMRIPGAYPVGSFITNPVFVFFAFNAVFALWHVPFYYDLALRDERFHILEHVMFFAIGVLSWWPVCSPMDELPPAHPLLQTAYLFFMSLPSTIIGALIAFAEAPLYPYYALRPRLWGISLGDDQQLAGLIMWVPGSLIYFAVLTVVFIRWLNREESDEQRPLANTG